jgi:uncharacterized OB-fold protein
VGPHKTSNDLETLDLQGAKHYKLQREDYIMGHGELTYCPKCGKEVYPASEACKNCGYAGEEIEREEG